jgi:hypothetical protein
MAKTCTESGVYFHHIMLLPNHSWIWEFGLKKQYLTTVGYMRRCVKLKELHCEVLSKSSQNVSAKKN